MAYNSAYKGSQVDSAVGAVLQKEKTWDNKQDKLTGTSGQVVGFDETGAAVAQAAPQTGLTQAEADGRYLQLSGGTVTGDIRFQGDQFLINGGGICLYAPGHGGGALYADGSNTDRLVFFNSTEEGPAFVGGIATPAADDDAANKGYVDSLIPRQTAITLTAGGWDATAKTQTVTVAGVVADEAKQLILPVPALSSQTAYIEAGILCTVQAANSLTFLAGTVPTEDLTVYVVVQGVAG